MLCNPLCQSVRVDGSLVAGTKSARYTILTPLSVKSAPRVRQVLECARSAPLFEIARKPSPSIPLLFFELLVNLAVALVIFLLQIHFGLADTGQRRSFFRREERGLFGCFKDGRLHQDDQFGSRRVLIGRAEQRSQPR